MTTTIAGGEPIDFISVIWPFLIQSIAASAFLSAGIALANDFSAWSFRSPASFAATLVFSSSIRAASYST